MCYQALIVDNIFIFQRLYIYIYICALTIGRMCFCYRQGLRGLHEMGQLKGQKININFPQKKEGGRGGRG